MAANAEPLVALVYSWAADKMVSIVLPPAFAWYASSWDFRSSSVNDFASLWQWMILFLLANEMYTQINQIAKSLSHIGAGIFFNKNVEKMNEIEDSLSNWDHYTRFSSSTKM